MIKVLVVDDQKMMREGIKALLEPESDFQIVGDADNGKAAIEQTGLLFPDVALLDIQMPKMDGITACQSITRLFPKTKVLILSSVEDRESINRALASGARGYLLKQDVFSAGTELSQAIRLVSKGHTQLLPGLIGKTSENIANNNQTELEVERKSSDFSQFKLEVLEEVKQEILEKLQEKANNLQDELSQQKASYRHLRRQLEKLEQILKNTAILIGIFAVILTIWCLHK